MKTKKNILNSLLLIIGVLILVNILSNRFFARIDLTKDKVYTLSRATKDVLKNLEEPVTVTAYFSEKLPTIYSRLRKEFKSKLIEFSNASKGKLVYEFIDPKDDAELKNKAREEGIMEVQIQIMEKDEATAQKAFMGAVIKIGDRQEAIPLIQSETGMEYDLTKAIKKLTINEKPKVAILQGHGEPGLQLLQNVYYELGSFYDVQSIYLTDTSYVLDRFNTLIVIAPKDSFPPSHLAQLSRFMEQGKSMLVALNTVSLDQTGQFGEKVETGLQQWLKQYGVNVNSDYVVDVNSPVLALPIQVAPGQVQRIPVKFYYFPSIVDFADHPITGGIEQVTFQVVSSVSYEGDSTISFTPLLKTSEMSNTKNFYMANDLLRKWSQSDFPLKGLTIGAAIEGNLAGTPTKMIVFGDGDFPIGDPQNAQIIPENLNLMVNSVDWLSDDTGLVGLRTKGAFSRPIKEMEQGKVQIIKIVNTVIPILLIILLGIFINIKNKNIQNKRREEGYV